VPGRQGQGKKILHINSTKLAGSAEMLSSDLPLLQDLGVDARWETISGNEAFFNVTKSFHNASRPDQHISQQMLKTYLEVNRENANAFRSMRITLSSTTPTCGPDQEPPGPEQVDLALSIDISGLSGMSGVS